MTWSAWGMAGQGGTGVKPPNDAPTGDPQHPTLFARYPIRPWYAVAGVDYRVGINTGVTLTDWRNLSNPYASVGASSVTFHNNGGDPILLDSIDFSWGGGAFLYFSNCQNITIQNCYFNGPNLLVTDGGVITFDSACTNLTIQYNEVDGGGNTVIPIQSIARTNPVLITTVNPHGFTSNSTVNIANCQGMTELNGASGQSTVLNVVQFTLPIDATGYTAYTGGGLVQWNSASTVFSVSPGPLTFHYNWFYHFPVRPISMAGNGTIDYKYNLFENGGYAYNDHLNFLEWTSSQDVNATIEYNTIIQAVTSIAGGEALQLYSNDPATINNPIWNNNVIIARTDNPSPPFPPMSYMFHGPSGSQFPMTFVGTGNFSNNFTDASGAYGWYYGSSITPNEWVIANNYDMLTSQLAIPEGTPSLTVANIAPLVEGGTSIISGFLANGVGGGCYLILDGSSYDNFGDTFQLASGTSFAFFCTSFTTPSAGSHVVSVHTFGIHGAQQLDVPFTVISASDPYLTISTPASGVIEGQAITISGTYVNAAPSGFTYTINGLNPRNAVTPTISEGNWSFTIEAPYNINNANQDTIGFWITVTGTGANTASVTSLPFATLSAPSLSIWKPYSDYAALTQELTISGYYTGPDPSGLSYYFDNDSPTDAPSPTIGNCNYSFNVLAPAPEGTHTVTVIGQGPNTNSATSASFRTSPQITMPGAPGAPTATLVAADIIAIAWTAPTSGSAVTSYAVEYELHNSADWIVSTPGVATLFYAFTGLAFSTSYDVRVNGRNLAGTGPYATTTGITTLSGFADGNSGAPAGVSPQLASLLSGYPSRPTWNVAGVDYGVGYPSATSLVDWQTLSGAGITVNASTVVFNGLTAPVIDAVDFSLHGGASVYLVGTTDATISNCNFGGTLTGANAAIVSDTASTGLTVRNCVFNSGPTYINDAVIYHQGGGTVLAEYCYSTVVQCHFLYLFDLGGGTVTVQWNVLNGAAEFYKGQTNAGQSYSLTMAFNTIATSLDISNAAVGIDLSADNGTLTTGVISNNVLVATGTNSMGFWLHGEPVTAGGFLFENWIDSTGGYGPFYGTSFTGWVTPANINLPDDSTLVVPT